MSDAIRDFIGQVDRYTRIVKGEAWIEGYARGVSDASNNHEGITTNPYWATPMTEVNPPAKDAE